jgi:hypothetical protein
MVVIDDDNQLIQLSRFQQLFKGIFAHVFLIRNRKPNQTNRTNRTNRTEPNRTAQTEPNRTEPQKNGLVWFGSVRFDSLSRIQSVDDDVT